LDWNWEANNYSGDFVEKAKNICQKLFYTIFKRKNPKIFYYFRNICFYITQTQKLGDKTQTHKKYKTSSSLDLSTQVFRDLSRQVSTFEFE
jgi:hypothetical protein